MQSFTVICLVSLLTISLAAVVPLPSFHAQKETVSVSGLSSGAFFAVQMHVSYSAQIKRAAIFAGGPYQCANGNLMTAEMTCMMATMPPDANTYIYITEDHASKGTIDPTSNLKNSKVYLFSGTIDTTVNPKVMNALYNYYRHYIPDGSSTGTILYTNNLPAAHTQPTDDKANKNSCLTSASPYLSYCGFDGAGVGLQVMYENKLKPRQTGALTGSIIEFDQKPFAPLSSPALISMANSGYAYVPAACARNGTDCMVHVAFHGCLQNYESVGMAWVEHTGLNLWADTNNIIVLYPQTIKSLIVPSNANGCWDWWGYASGQNDYATKNGAQMKMIKAIIDHVTA